MPNSDGQYAQSSTWQEILSQPTVWQTVLEQLSHSQVVDRIIADGAAQEEWLFVGCGTSFYLAEAAAFSWTKLTGQSSRALPASEILLYPKLGRSHGRKVKAVVISRSGKTSEAVRAAHVLVRELRVATVGITCTEASELERACNTTIVLPGADERSTVMTRSFTSMLIALQYLAARRAKDQHFADQLAASARQLAKGMRPLSDRIEQFVQQHSFADYVFLGQGAFHGIAREAALKVMEMSCSYSQFFHTLEFRHGPKAIVSPETCLTFFLSDTGYEAETEVLQEMKELGGATMAVCNRATDTVRKASDVVVEFQFSGDELAGLAPGAVPCQLLGFFTGLQKGLNPDHPKNLTRVVLLD
jgi:glucosamine--fructose-6-phosphate aminotransferase (isomerizing)